MNCRAALLTGAFAAGLLPAAPVVNACPWVLPNGESSNRLYAQRDGQWQEVPVQDASGIGRVFSDNHWGKNLVAGSAFPCDVAGGASQVREVRPAAGSPDVLYLMACPGKSPAFPSPVAFYTKTSEIRSKGFVYAYDPNNLAMFRSVVVRPGTPQEALASRSPALSLRADIRHFFTLNFDESDIGAVVSDVRQGPVASSGVLGFSLKVLFFRIHFDVGGTAFFFDDSALVPMMLKMVSDGPKSVYPATGTFFTWEQVNGKFDPALLPGGVPELRPELVKKGFQALVPIGIGRCDSTLCRYSMAGKIDSQWFAMDYIVPRSAVEKGFFPMVTYEPAKSRKGLGWDPREDDAGPNRVGVYFENSGLTKGDYQWATWLRVVRDPADLARTCPWTPVLSALANGEKTP